MSKSNPSYEEDLPDDILELIDHTTRGVRRLYETTRSTETGDPPLRQRKDSQRQKTPRARDGSGAHLLSSNNTSVQSESAVGAVARHCPWNRTRALPVSSAAEGRSGVTTTNTTISSDGPYAREREQPRQLPKVSMKESQDRSRGYSANGSAAEDSGGSRLTRRWKETFKSLLSDPPPHAQCAPAGPSESPPILDAPAVPPPAAASHSQSPEAMARAAAEVSAETEAQLRALRQQHAEDAEAHREALARLRLDHQRELAEQSRAAHEERQRVGEEVSARLLASFSVKQKLLRAELEGERVRADEAERSLAESRAAYGETAAQRSALHEKAAAAEASLAALQRAHAQTESRLSAAQRDAMEGAQREAKAAERVQELEAQLTAQREAQEREAREARARAEAAFADAARGYESLVREAGEKLSALERVARRYRQLRAAHAKRGHELEALRAADAERRSELEAMSAAHAEDSARAEGFAREAEELRQLSARREHDMREERAAAEQRCRESAEALRRAEAELRCRESERDEALAAGAGAEALAAERAGERAEAESAAEALRAELSEVRRGAAQAHAQAEGTIASLKRQLREKDARLETLATATAEPVQRLRAQLEDERGRRAGLEEQFAQYKKRAKAAEEAAMREIRREQVRTPSAQRQAQASLSLSPSPARSQGPSKAQAKNSITNGKARIEVGESNARTPTDQRARAPSAQSAPPSYTRSMRSVSVSGTSVTRSPLAVISSGVNGGERGGENAHEPMDSVGSISNISCSSAYCSSDEGIGPTARAPSAAHRGAPYRQHTTKKVQQQQLQGQEEKQLYPHKNNANNKIHHGEWVKNAVEDEVVDDEDDDDMDRSIAHHEQMLREFHQSAAEVFRKITGNRDEFLEKCTSVVRSVYPSANLPQATTALADASDSD